MSKIVYSPDKPNDCRKSYTSKQMEDKIIQLLEQWQKKREKSMER